MHLHARARERKGKKSRRASEQSRGRGGWTEKKKEKERLCFAPLFFSLDRAWAFFLALKMAASRPLVTVQGLDGTASGQTALPAVFTAPIRPDVVLQVRAGKEKSRLQSLFGGWTFSLDLSAAVPRSSEPFVSAHPLLSTHAVCLAERLGARGRGSFAFGGGRLMMAGGSVGRRSRRLLFHHHRPSRRPPVLHLP